MKSTDVLCDVVVEMSCGERRLDTESVSEGRGRRNGRKVVKLPEARNEKALRISECPIYGTPQSVTRVVGKSFVIFERWSSIHYEFMLISLFKLFLKSSLVEKVCE
jgi:hypothetical protein